MRRGQIFLLLLATFIGPAAQAQDASFSGKWLFSGQILSSRSATSFAQICDLQQTGDQLAGLCRGPNGGCSAVGVINGGAVDLTCRLNTPANPAISGVLTFHGEPGPDSVLRGPVSHSKVSNGKGIASLLRI